jgi:hypothetical protein
MLSVLFGYTTFSKYYSVVYLFCNWFNFLIPFFIVINVLWLPFLVFLCVWAREAFVFLVPSWSSSPSSSCSSSCSSYSSNSSFMCSITTLLVSSWSLLLQLFFSPTWSTSLSSFLMVGFATTNALDLGRNG